ncbi:MAG: C4-dicarboxylate ABC transporter substrate-binding protein, partial [Deltaproteobacteria bacterium]
EVYTLPKKEMARWNKLLEPIIDKWIKDAEARGIPAKKILKDIKKLNKKYSKKYGG